MANKPNKAQKFADSLSTSNLIVVAVLISFLSAGIAIVVGRSLINNMVLNARVISKKNAANKQISNNYTALKNLQTEYNGLGAIRETIETSMPKRPNLPELYTMMENLGNTSQVTTQSVSPTTTTDVDAVPGTGLQKLTVSVSVSGSYASIKTYLKNIELSARPLHIDSLNLGGNDTTMQASIVMTTYYQGAADLSIGSEVIK